MTKPKYNIGDKVFQCRNSSYLFNTLADIMEAIDEVEIVSVSRISGDVVYYMVKVSGTFFFQHEQIESKLYKCKHDLLDKLIKGNISFINLLVKSCRADISLYQKNIETCNYNIDRYMKLKDYFSLYFKK